jgi:hypothetical protein
MPEPSPPPSTVRLLDDRGQPTPEFWRLLLDASRVMHAARVGAQARNCFVMEIMFGDTSPSLSPPREPQ